MRSLLRKRRLDSAATDPSAAGTSDMSALRRVVSAIGASQTSDAAISTVLEVIREEFGWAYGSYWAIDKTAGVLRFHQEAGSVNKEFREVTLKATFAPGVGVAGRTWKSQKLTFVEDLSEVHDCVRAPVARLAGVKSGVCLPITVKGTVVGTMDFFSTSVMVLSAERRQALEAVADLVSQALTRLIQTAEAIEMAADSAAVTEVLAGLSAQTTEQGALSYALDQVRRAFGWAYGSVWKIGTDDLLHFAVQSGTVNPEFQKVTLAASFAEGVGLSGRAWRTRNLVFVPDLAQVTDCVRAPVAGRAGVKSGVCFPIIVNGQVLATMDFFAMETVTLAPSRLKALTSIGELVSQAIERLKRAVSATEVAGELSASVDHVAVGASRATAVASEAVSRAERALDVMRTLDGSSRAIGNIAKVISSIAEQTNLLALNATIEAARAGEAGKGFAVVANEVKDLSRETSKATDDVTQKINTIQADVVAATAVIESIGDTIREIHEIQADLASVLEEQATIAQAFSRA